MQHWRKVFVALAAATLTVVTTAGAAVAAEARATEATLTGMSFVEDVVQSGSSAQLSGTWSLPDNPSTPAGLTVALPEALQGLSDAFALLDPAGVAMGQCVVTDTAIECEFDSAYLAAHPQNLRGRFTFWVTVTTEVTDTTTVTYNIGGVTTSTTVSPPGAGCPDCTFDGQSTAKWGTYFRDSDTVDWGILVAAPVEGMAGGQTVTITERLGAGQTWARHDDGSIDIMLLGTGHVDPVAGPDDWQAVDATITENVGSVTITFTTREGWFYLVLGTSATTDGGAAGTYENEADVTIGSQNTTPVDARVVRHGGGGTGSGDSAGTFSITKKVVWSDQAISGLTFSGTYAVTLPTGVVVDGSFDVAADQTWVSPSYPAGSVVHLEETLPKAPAGIDWATPSFSQNDFAIAGNSVVASTLTNTATAAVGRFQAKKVISGNAASLLPAGSSFTLAYDYPAGPGFSAGSGTLSLPADGTVVNSAPLPVGAELTLRELTPAAVEGATWAAPMLSASTLTVGRGEIVGVTVTNVLSRAALSPATSTTSPTPTAVSAAYRTLAVTGGESSFPLLWAGIAAVVLGAVALRRRAKDPAR